MEFNHLHSSSVVHVSTILVEVYVCTCTCAWSRILCVQFVTICYHLQCTFPYIPRLLASFVSGSSDYIPPPLSVHMPLWNVISEHIYCDMSFVAGCALSGCCPTALNPPHTCFFPKGGSDVHLAWVHLYIVIERTYVLHMSIKYIGC